MSPLFQNAVSFITTHVDAAAYFLSEIVNKNYCQFWDGFYNLNATYGPSGGILTTKSNADHQKTNPPDVVDVSECSFEEPN